MMKNAARHGDCYCSFTGLTTEPRVFVDYANGEDSSLAFGSGSFHPWLQRPRPASPISRILQAGVSQVMSQTLGRKP